MNTTNITKNIDEIINTVIKLQSDVHFLHEISKKNQLASDVFSEAHHNLEICKVSLSVKESTLEIMEKESRVPLPSYHEKKDIPYAPLYRNNEELKYAIYVKGTTFVDYYSQLKDGLSNCKQSIEDIKIKINDTILHMPPPRTEEAEGTPCRATTIAWASRRPAPPRAGSRACRAPGQG